MADTDEVAPDSGAIALRLTHVDVRARLRGFVDGRPIVDSERSIIISEPGRPASFIATPGEDVDASAFRRAQQIP